MNKFALVSTLVLISILHSVAFGGTSEIATQDGEQIFIRGINAQINYTVNPASRSLRWTMPDGAGWSFEKRGAVLTFQGEEPDSRAEVDQMVKRLPAKVMIDISGPSLPVEIHLFDGVVNLTRGQHDARVVLRQGRVSSQQRSGILRVFGGRVDVQVSDQNGRVETDLFSGTQTVRNLKGEGRLEAFNGTLQLEGAQGVINLSSRQGTVKAQKVTGSLNVDLNKGQLTTQDVQGRLDAKLGETTANLNVPAETEVSVVDQNSRIQIQLPAASGARLQLRSTSGEIVTPAEVRVGRNAEGRSAVGNVKGASKKVHVSVRSEEGRISVK